MASHIKFLLDYCQDKAELYNNVSTKLWVQFGIRSAELNLLCTFIASEVLKDEYRKGNKRTDKKVGRSKKTKEINTNGYGKNNRGKQTEYS